jgi:PAS domain S-box-containing protein
MIALKTGQHVNDVLMGVYNPLKTDTVWINVCAVPLFKPGEKQPFQVYATFQDISQRIKAQYDLQLNEEQYRQLFNEINYGIALHEMIFDNEGKPVNYRFLKVNPAFESIMGMKADEIVGKTVLAVMPELEYSWIQKYGEVVSSGIPIHFTQYSKELNKHFEVRAFRPATGQFAVIAHDMTEFKAIETALGDNINMLNMAMETANMAWWDLDLVTGQVAFSSKKAEMLGYPPENFTHYRDFVNIVHPDDIARIMKAMQDHIDGLANIYDTHYRIKTISGGYKWFHDAGSIVKRSPEGLALRATGLVFDVTDHKKTEDALMSLGFDFQKKDETQIPQ